MALAALAVACAAPAAAPVAPAPLTSVPSQATWQQEWEKTLVAARKEGKLVIYITSGPDMQGLLRTAIKDKFGLDIEFVSGTASELANKALAEKRAGLHLGDLSIGGTGTPITDLKPAGVLAPLKPLLLLPEILDSGAYFDSELPFVDKEGTYVFSYGLNVANTIAVNSDLVRAGDIKGYAALLEPKWKDKIIIFDPTMAGTGVTWFYVVSDVIMNADFHRQLARQNPFITRDKRLQIDWVVRAKYSVALAPSKDTVSQFQQVGAPIKWVIPAEGRYVSGTDAIAYFDKAPHPNAARVFLNWLLSKEGLTAYSQNTLMQTARKDVPTGFLSPDVIRDPNSKAFNTAKEEVRWKIAEAGKLAKEIYGPLSK
ncbi:MAG: extracellular solute-binding protein [Chloroflexi bacterium]|nr:extracellular solute-binding protein [Chloroflexota bacterium]